MLKAFIFGSLLLSSSMVHADWDPEYCFIDESETSLNELNNQKFKILKEKVAKQLANSWCSTEKVNLLMDLILVTKPEVCVEIGAFTGSSVLPVAATLNFLRKGKIFAIDAWSNDVIVKNLSEDDPNRLWWSKADMKGAHNAFNAMVKSWKLNRNCVGIESTSEKAVNRFDTIDFLHIDGDYSEVGSLQDVNLYLPKVKSGGYILLSNLFLMINGKQPKLKAFCTLFESCEMVCEIEHDNAVLFKKL